MTTDASDRSETLRQREDAVRRRELSAAAVESSQRALCDALNVRADALESRTELTTQNGELREANEKLVLVTLNAQILEGKAKAVSRQQEEFLAMLAHELRNPLAPIMTAVELISQLDGRPVPIGLVDIMRRQINHLVRLVDDLLDVSRVTQGKIALQKHPLQISEILQQAVETSRQKIDKRRQRLDLDLSAASVFVLGDSVRLLQVFSNLLQNAVKYTQEGGEIVVGLRVVQGTVEVTIRDNGMGISPEVLPHIFDLFTQDERTLGREAGGLGIGLTIVRRMVVAHGGTVVAESAGVSLGSVFTVVLPQLDGPGDVDVKRTDAGSKPVQAHVLVVEDNRDAGETMAELLRSVGHVVDLATDGPSGLALFELVRPQVVLCDIGLPGMNGYEVAARMCASSHKPRPALIAVTGYGGPRNAELAKAAGFDHYVTKPVDLKLLLRLVNETLRTRGSAYPTL